MKAAPMQRAMKSPERAPRIDEQHDQLCSFHLSRRYCAKSKIELTSPDHPSHPFDYPLFLHIVKLIHSIVGDGFLSLVCNERFDESEEH